jgi:hypothetical protein
MATQKEADALLAKIMEMVKDKEAAKASTPVHGPLRLRVKQEVSYTEMEEEEFGSSSDEKEVEKRPSTPKWLAKRRFYDKVYYREKRSKLMMFCHVCNHQIKRHHKSAHVKSVKHRSRVALLVQHGITPQSPTPI